MKILQLTSNDARTGGGIQVSRLNTVLRRLGHDSSVLVGGGGDSSEFVQQIARAKTWRGMDWAAQRAGEFFALPDLFRPSSHLWRRAIAALGPDILHLHWAYGGRGSNGIPIQAISDLANRYPLIWTFHDMWGFTGGCTNALGCERWQIGCGQCPQLANRKATTAIRLRRDTTAFLWRTRQAAYRAVSFAVVCPSAWLADLARHSPLLQSKPIYHIPNGLDTTVFRPLPKQSCRDALGIPQDRLVVLFIGKASSVFAYEERVPIFVSALRGLRERLPGLAAQVTLLIVGERGEALASMTDYPAVCLGPVTRPQLMALSYSAADVLVHATQYDNLPGVVQESLACGTPVVASQVGGVPEMVQHQETGFLCRPDSPSEFVDGMRWLLEDEASRRRCSEAGRHVILQHFSEDVVLPVMIDRYQAEIDHFRSQSLTRG